MTDSNEENNLGDEVAPLEPSEDRRLPLHHALDDDEGFNSNNTTTAETKKEEQAMTTNTAAGGSTETHYDFPPSRLDVVEEWANGTTIHGANHVWNREHLLPWRRRLWLVILMASTGVMIWQIYELVHEYMKFDTKTNVRIVVPPSLPFPQVTICNLNSVQTSRVNTSGLQSNPVNEEELISVSQPLEEFIQSTTYNFGDDLNVTEVWTPVVTNGGLCFQFDTSERIVRPGLEGGLLVSLYVNSADYYNETFNGGGAVVGVGVQIFVAQKDTTEVQQVPFDLAQPGTLLYLGMKRAVIKREKQEPWTRCFGEAPQFTQPKCREGCIETLVRETCNCRDYGDTVDTSLPFCSDYAKCYQQVYDADNKDCEDDCSDPPCYEELYTTRSSSLELLSPGSNAQDNADSVAILINYEAIRQEEVTETRSQTFPQLLANIGGQMGLFMGLSIISIIEVFGELLPLRLLPRLWGDRRLYGLGSQED